MERSTVYCMDPWIVPDFVVVKFRGETINFYIKASFTQPYLDEADQHPWQTDHS